jgi:hypothetical protein
MSCVIAPHPDRIAAFGKKRIHAVTATFKVRSNQDADPRSPMLSSSWMADCPL